MQCMLRSRRIPLLALSGGGPTQPCQVRRVLAQEMYDRLRHNNNEGSLAAKIARGTVAISESC